MSAIIPPTSYSGVFYSEALNLEPCILQKCNTFNFGNQTFYSNRFYYRVIWYVPVIPLFINIYQCTVLQLIIL